LGPTIEELAAEYQGKAVIGKLNAAEATDIARQYKIPGYPTMLFFKDGKQVDKMVGAATKPAIAEKLDSLIRL
jgi:thioredoxin 1